MQVKLSVCLITYNHKRFIKQALDGVLMQQAGFDWEVVIGDDGSTDGTTEIVEEYARNYPGRVRLAGYKNNAGMTMNWVRTIEACKGEYIAILEGDDYWTDPRKIQKQIDILDKERHLSFTCHDVETIFDDGVPTVDYLSHPGVSREYTAEELLVWNQNFFVPTGSIIFRRSMLDKFPAWVNKSLKIMDITTELLLASKGPFYYINQVMGVYRVHTGGVSQILWANRQHLLEFDVIQVVKLFNTYTNYKYNETAKVRLELMYRGLMRKNPQNSVAYRKALFGLLAIDRQKNLHFLKDWIINNYLPPALYKFYKRVF